MCGEKKSQIKSALAKLGSPPHVRGKVQKNCLQSSTTGITPACAGKSSWKEVDKANVEDHPACAGKSFGLHCQNQNSEDHPRMCGEKEIADSSIAE